MLRWRNFFVVNSVLFTTSGKHGAGFPAPHFFSPQAQKYTFGSVSPQAKKNWQPCFIVVFVLHAIFGVGFQFYYIIREYCASFGILIETVAVLLCLRTKQAPQLEKGEEISSSSYWCKVRYE